MAPVAIAALLVAVLVAGACGGRVAGECPQGCGASFSVPSCDAGPLCQTVCTPVALNGTQDCSGATACCAGAGGGEQ